jgi:hypothetical protein
MQELWPKGLHQPFLKQSGAFRPGKCQHLRLSSHLLKSFSRELKGLAENDDERTKD